VASLEGLAQAAARDGRSVVVFLDNASFHRSAGVRSRREAWARCGLVLYYLPLGTLCVPFALECPCTPREPGDVIFLPEGIIVKPIVIRQS